MPYRSSPKDDVPPGMHDNLARHFCSHCSRGFTRKEHMLRHQRTHTHESPYLCDGCHQRFTRQDVYQRHVKKFCREREDDGAGGTKSRTIQACNRCRSHKTKCDGRAPCARCAARNNDCNYTFNTSSVDGPGTPSSSLSGMVDSNVDFLFDLSWDAQNEYDQQFMGSVPMMASTNQVREPMAADVLSTSAQADLSFQSQQSDSFRTGDCRARGEPGSAPQQCTGVPSIRPHWAAQVPVESVCAPQDVGLDTSFLLNTLLVDQWAMELESCNPAHEGLDFFNEDFDRTPSHSVGAALPPTVENPTIPSNGPGHALPQNAAQLRDAELCSPISRSAGGVSTSMIPPQFGQNIPNWVRNLRPTINHFDTEIVNYFVDKFLWNTGSAFPTFKNFRVTENTLPDVILAMAAVGGLFCKIEDSFLIAAAMYTDARRLVSGRDDSDRSLEVECQLNIIQTYISLELFGLCSGDVKSFECTEVFHLQMLQVLADFPLIDTTSDSSQEVMDIRYRLLNSVYMLETYRVVLLQRPPKLYPTFTAPERLVSPPNSHSGVRSSLPNMNASRMLRTLVSPHLFSSCAMDDLDSTFCLTSLAILSWHAKPALGLDISSQPVWSKEVVEVALHRWTAQEKPFRKGQEPWEIFIFHLVLINLHTPVSQIHNIVHAECLGIGAAKDTLATLTAWHDSKDCQKALWHSNALLDVARSLIAFGSSNASNVGERQPGADKLTEAPHLALSLYIATLTLWTAATRQKPTNLRCIRSILESGIHTLSSLDTRSASMLSKTLRRLGNST